MAQSANIVNVKVICDEETNQNVANIIQAFEDILKEHTSRRDANPPTPNWRGSVVSMSFGTISKNNAVGRALGNLKDAGALSVAAAGNMGTDQPEYPCSYEPVICVGASDQRYGRWVGCSRLS